MGAGDIPTNSTTIDLEREVELMEQAVKLKRAGAGSVN